MDWMVGIFAFVFGSIVGSFLNVCILRLPENQSIAFPGSHCMSCRTPIAWYDNIPILSYCLLGGKCRACAKHFSVQYPIIEAITGVIFVIFWLRFGLTFVGATYLAMTLGLLVQSVIDARYKIIPDEITIPGMLFGLVISFTFPQLHDQTTHVGGVLWSLLGLLLGGGFLWGAGSIAEKILKKEAMGGGDVKLLAMIGAIIGWKGVLWTIFVSSFIGSAVGIYLRIRKGEETIPFGPFLALAAVLYLFIGTPCIQWYLHVLGRG